MAKKCQTYVQYKTVCNSVEKLSNKQGESKVCRVGKHKVIVTKLGKDKRGRDRHLATLLKENGRLGDSQVASGAPVRAISGTLKKNGVEIKYHRKKVDPKK